MAEHNKVPRWFMRNSAGKPDAMWTLTFVAFLITTIVYFVSGLGTMSIGAFTFTPVQFDAGYAGVVLVPLLMAYFGRRYTSEAIDASIERARISSRRGMRHVDVIEDDGEEVLR